MLRQFYYIDLNGKDQGINVRNRAKELAELLSDVDRIRQERKKARSNRNKYAGVEGGASTFGSLSNSGLSSSGGNGFGRRYGGFGSDSGQTADFGGYSGGVYGDGGGFSSGGGARGDFHDMGSDYNSRSTSRNKQFDEYDEYDEGDAPSSTRAASSRRHQTLGSTASAAAKPPPPKKTAPVPAPPAPEPDLLGGFDDPLPAPSASGKGKTTTTNSSSALDDFGALTSGGADDDDFDEFQSATPAPGFNPNPPPAMTSSASQISLMQPKPLSTQQHNDIGALVGMTSPTVSGPSTPALYSHGTGTGSISSLASMNMGSAGAMPNAAMRPMNTGGAGYMPSQPNYFTSVPVAANNVASPLSPSSTGSSMQPQKKAGSDAFGSIWNQASSGIKKTSTPSNSTPTASLQAMAKEKASAGIWGTTPAPSSAGMGMGAATAPPVQKTGGDLDDLLG